jgi:2-keto-4-pentenoate hydratase/2-oxohepta-3-ene-1,7-dioic acid hydratase in catechol pathway
MRWVSYLSNETERAGVIAGHRIHGLPPGETVLGLLGDDGERLAAAGQRALADPAEVIDAATARLGPPLRPPSIRDCVGFLQHVRNTRPAAPIDPLFQRIPAFYFSNAASVTGPYDPVRVFPGSEQFDYELEVGAVIGRPASDLNPEDAERYICGYVIFCDWSARDIQLEEMRLGLGPAKGKDGASTLGPVLVTPDELAGLRSGDSLHLEMTASVNGQPTSRGWLDDMDWSFAELLAYTSRGTTLRPGDLIGSGTVPTGCLLEAALADPGTFRGWLEPGDVVSLAVTGLGTTRQQVLPSHPAHRLCVRGFDSAAPPGRGAACAEQHSGIPSANTDAVPAGAE